MKILILPLFGLGDTLMMTPALQVLKDKNKSFQIDVLTLNKTNYEILKNNPHIDNLFNFPFLTKSKIESFIYFLKNFSFKYDTAINFFPSNRKEYNILSFLTFAKKRLGHTYYKCNFRELNFLKNKTVKEDYSLHNVEENIRLLNFLNITPPETLPPMQVYLTDKEKKLGKKFVNANKNKYIKLIGIHPGCSKFKNHQNKRLPVKTWIEIINFYKKHLFFIFGTTEEIEIMEEIKKSCNNTILIKNKNIREVAAIIQYLDLFLSNDSGLMHLSAAVNTPVIAIFGPTNPQWVGPWKTPHKIVKLDLECSPCFEYSPKPLICYKNSFECLQQINAKTIINSIEEICHE